MDVLSAWVSFGEAMIAVFATYWPLIVLAVIAGVVIGSQS